MFDLILMVDLSGRYGKNTEKMRGVSKAVKTICRLHETENRN